MRRARDQSPYRSPSCHHAGGAPRTARMRWSILLCVSIFLSSGTFLCARVSSAPLCRLSTTPSSATHQRSSLTKRRTCAAAVVTSSSSACVTFFILRERPSTARREPPRSRLSRDWRGSSARSRARACASSFLCTSLCTCSTVACGGSPLSSSE
eukprot:scaffold115211_cov69-Phaeocystis_antarctica.AAC.3